MMSAPAAGEPQVAPVSVTTRSGHRIHAIQTGFVAVKEAHRRLRGPAALRFATIFFWPRWTEWLPILAWVIEHPEGVIVVDAGEASRAATDPAFFGCDPANAWIYKRILRFRVTPADEIGWQLRHLGIAPEDVRWVVLTHLHSDHADGIHTFPGAHFIVPRADYPRSVGAVPCLWPDWFRPRFPNFQRYPHYGFDRTHRLTVAGDVLLVPTPGHSPGHQSLIVVDDDVDWFIAGDASFDAAQMQREEVAGICANVGAARNTLRTIKSHLRQRRSVYLPSHDPGSAARLHMGLVTEPDP